MRFDVAFPFIHWARHTDQCLQRALSSSSGSVTLTSRVAALNVSFNDPTCFRASRGSLKKRGESNVRARDLNMYLLALGKPAHKCAVIMCHKAIFYWSKLMARTPGDTGCPADLRPMVSDRVYSSGCHLSSEFVSLLLHKNIICLLFPFSLSPPVGFLRRKAEASFGRLLLLLKQEHLQRLQIPPLHL